MRQRRKMNAGTYVLLVIAGIVAAILLAVALSTPAKAAPIPVPTPIAPVGSIGSKPVGWPVPAKYQPVAPDQPKVPGRAPDAPQ